LIEGGDEDVARLLLGTEGKTLGGFIDIDDLTGMAIQNRIVSRLPEISTLRC
jgi:hypothetical protein